MKLRTLFQVLALVMGAATLLILYVVFPDQWTHPGFVVSALMVALNVALLGYMPIGRDPATGVIGIRAVGRLITLPVAILSLVAMVMGFVIASIVLDIVWVVLWLQAVVFTKASAEVIQDAQRKHGISPWFQATRQQLEVLSMRASSDEDKAAGRRLMEAMQFTNKISPEGCQVLELGMTGLLAQVEAGSSTLTEIEHEFKVKLAESDSWIKGQLNAR